MNDLIVQLGVSGVTVAIMLFIFLRLREDVKEQIAEIRSDARYNLEQLVRLLDNCLDQADTETVKEQIAERYNGKK